MSHDQTVYQAGRVEGVLRLSVPPVNLGYDEAYMGGSKPGMGEAESTFMGRQRVMYGYRLAADKAPVPRFVCDSTECPKRNIHILLHHRNGYQGHVTYSIKSTSRACFAIVLGLFSPTL